MRSSILVTGSTRERVRRDEGQCEDRLRKLRSRSWRAQQVGSPGASSVAASGATTKRWEERSPAGVDGWAGWSRLARGLKDWLDPMSHRHRFGWVVLGVGERIEGDGTKAKWGGEGDQWIIGWLCDHPTESDEGWCWEDLWLGSLRMVDIFWVSFMIDSVPMRSSSLPCNPWPVNLEERLRCIQTPWDPSPYPAWLRWSTFEHSRGMIWIGEMMMIRNWKLKSVEKCLWSSQGPRSRVRSSTYVKWNQKTLGLNDDDDEVDWKRVEIELIESK